MSMSQEEKEKQKIKKIDREILHFLFTVMASAVTAMAIVSLAIK